MQPYPWDALLGEMLPILLLTGIALLVGIPLIRQFRKQASFMDDQSRIANEVAERSETQIRKPKKATAGRNSEAILCSRFSKISSAN